MTAERVPTAATAAALVAVVAVVYGNALNAGFVGDDFMILHRLRAMAGPSDVLRFFRGEFFEYYRPLGFVAQAVDWAIARDTAAQFHFTNILIHAANTVLVLLIGRSLAPGPVAGPLAALLFAVHASNHEAVVWISARFDLLATLFSLAAVWWTIRQGRGAPIAAPILFLCAMLSKESAVALPVAAAAFAVFCLRTGRVETARRLAPWLAALAAYGVLRHVAGGVSPIGGASRLPKLAAFLVLLAALVLAAGGRWLRAGEWLRANRGLAATAAIAGVAAMCAVAIAGGPAGRLAEDKLAVAGFSLFHLASPVLDRSDVPFYLREGTTISWLGGAIALVCAIAAAAAAWRFLVDDDRIWFLGAFLVAALLPISALTEGTRYLYLPSAAASLIVAMVAVELRGRARAAAGLVIGLLLALSTVQVVVKVRDWVWAGRMTAEGARLVDASLAPSCGDGHVVFLTEPVGIRSVYTHFLYETFEVPRGCMPAVFQVLLRIVRVDATVDARRDGPSRIVLTVPRYRGNFLASADLRNFDVPIRGDGRVTVDTPLGVLQGESAGDIETLTLSLRPGIDPARIQFFYYSDGHVRPLAN